MANRRTQVLAGALTAILVAVGLAVGASPDVADASRSTKQCLQTEYYDHCYTLTSAKTVRVGDVAKVPVKWDSNVSAVKYRWYRCEKKVSFSNNFDAPSVSVPAHCKSVGATSQTRAVTTSDLGKVLAVYSEGFYKGATNKVFAPVSKSGVEGSKLDGFSVDVPKKVAPKQTFSVKVKTDKISPAPSKVEIAFRDCVPNTLKKSCGAFETGAAKHVAPTFGEVEVVVTVRRGDDSKSTTKLVLVDSSAPVVTTTTTIKPTPSTTAKPTVSTTKPATGAIVPLSKFDFTVPKSVGVGQQIERRIQWNGVTGATSVTQFRLCYVNADRTEGCDPAVSNTYTFTPKREGTVFIEVTASRKEGGKTLTATKSKNVAVTAATAASNAPGFKTAWIGGTLAVGTEARAQYTLQNAAAHSVSASWSACNNDRQGNCKALGVGNAITIPEKAAGKILKVDLVLKDGLGKPVATKFAVTSKPISAACSPTDIYCIPGSTPPATTPVCNDPTCLAPPTTTTVKPSPKPQAPPAPKPDVAPSIRKAELKKADVVSIGETIEVKTFKVKGRPKPKGSYAWFRCDAKVETNDNAATPAGCVAIDGQTKKQYELVAADAGKFIVVKLTATNRKGEAVRWLPTAAGAVGSSDVAPAITKLEVTGELKTGAQLTAVATATGTPAPTVTYQWMRCNADATECVSVDGATSDKYLVAAADVADGAHLGVQATAMQPSGKSATQFTLVGAPTPPPPAAAAPTISKASISAPSSLMVGNTATMAVEATGTPSPTVTYQWFRCDAKGEATATVAVFARCTSIAGMTNATYTIAAADIGKFVAATATASNSNGAVSVLLLASASPVTAAVA